MYVPTEGANNIGVSSKGTQLARDHRQPTNQLKIIDFQLYENEQKRLKRMIHKLSEEIFST